MKGHWQRFLLQLAILISMSVVYSVDNNLFTLLVSASLIVIPTGTWTVFGILLWMSNKAPEIETLADRVDDALSAALASSVAAVIGAAIILKIAHLIDVPIGPLINVGLAFVVVTAAVPSLTYLRTAVRVWLPMIRRRKT